MNEVFASIEDVFTTIVGNFDILNLPSISFVFKKSDIDRITDDRDTYQRLTTSKCPIGFMRNVITPLKI